MKRIAILTAAGDKPVPTPFVHGAGGRPNLLEFEIIGVIKWFDCRAYPREPYVHLNPLYRRFTRTMLSTCDRRFLLRATWGSPAIRSTRARINAYVEQWKQLI